MDALRSRQIFRQPRKFAVGAGSMFPLFNIPSNFVQRMGAGQYDSFFSGTFTTGSHTFGYIRLADFEYVSSSDMTSEIQYFQAHTDGLIIDLMRNPGGYGCTAEAFLSYLAPNGLTSMGNSQRVTWDNIVSLEESLASAQYYGATTADIQELQTELKASQDAYTQSRGMTPPMPICGNSVNLTAVTLGRGGKLAYSKPVMLLVDELTASAAELFAGVLQDNQRAMVYGYRTDGAGGSVGVYAAGVYSETGSSLAQSILVRTAVPTVSDFPAMPYIENIGIRPDVTDDYMTADNLVNGGATFVSNFLSAMDKYVSGGN